MKRNLPKVERELRGMVQEYDNRHGKILKIKQKYGVSIYNNKDYNNKINNFRFLCTFRF